MVSVLQKNEGEEIVQMVTCNIKKVRKSEREKMIKYQFEWIWGGMDIATNIGWETGE